VDDIGKTVTIASTPKRIVSMTPSVTEILFALGLGDRVVGVTYGCDYPHIIEALNIEKISEMRPAMGSGPGPAPSSQPFGLFYIDKIVNLRPDLVIMDRSYDDWQLYWYSKVKSMGLNILMLWAKSFEDVLRDITLVGKVTSSQENATKLVNALEQRLVAVQKQIGNLSESDKPRVFATAYYDGIHNPWTFSSGYHKPINFVDEIIEKACGINVMKDYVRTNANGERENFFDIDLETVLRTDPQIIFAIDDPRYPAPTYESIINDKRLIVTQALQKNAVYKVDMRPWVRPGPRLVDSIELVAKTLYPKLSS
jgi:iron complex transport system substrate-binding protein